MKKEINKYIGRSALFLLLCALCSVLSFAQKQANMWYFGSYAGLDFNSGSPVSFTGSAMNMLEGCASIADTGGNTLFYTDGLTVWNKNNLQMPNGFGLLGDNNAAQSAIIVPAPGSSTLYYIFTSPTNGNAPMHYSVVDMTLQAGLGDVTTKNTVMFNNSTEKVTAVRHANGQDIWVIGHEFNTNNFYSYLVTSSGVSTTPVITGVGSVHSGVLGFAGYMKASHNGKKLAYAITITLNIAEVFDFNDTTGVMSNPITFPNISEAYGLEFSADDSKLYVTEENPQLIIQWDLSLGSSAAIIASQTTIGTGNGSGFAALQLAPDGKIYLAKRMNITDLGVINNPNLAGAASNFVDHAVTLASGTSSLYGLPNFFQSYFVPSSIPVSSFISSDTSFCNESGKCISFFDHSTGNPTSWKWFFPGAISDSSLLQNPDSICYYNSGTYPVTLIVSNSNGTDTLIVSPMITVGNPPAPPVITVTGADTLISSHAAHYQWYLNGSPIANAIDSFYIVHQGGTYSVQITDSLGCNSLSAGMIMTGVTFDVSDFQFQVYPNPAQKQLVISHRSSAIFEIEIFNALGETVYALPTADYRLRTVIDVSSFAKGLYVISVISRDKVYRTKFAKD